MSSFRPHLSQKSAAKQPATRTNPVKDKSELHFRIDGQRMGGREGVHRSSSPKSKEPDTKARNSRKRGIPMPPAKPSSSFAADAHPDSHTPTLPTSTEEEEPTISPKDYCESEELATSPKDHCEAEEVEVVSSQEKKEVVICPICLDDCTEPKELDKCGHVFCTECIDPYFQNIKPQCPCCFTIYGEIRGNQPEDGQMTVITINRRLPGFGRTSKGSIQITYTFPDGIQTDKHPNPGMPYSGTTRQAYLPDNDEGRHVLELLQTAFKLHQIFTIGQSRTTGCDNVVTWNDIHHKTSFSGGMNNFGYPDNTYLNRVQQELAAKGIK